MSGINVLDHEYLQKYGDPRISMYPFMENPILTIIFTIAYFVATVVGIFVMKNRQPLGLRIPLFLYSMSVVLLSSWMFLKLGIHGWFTKYNWGCEPIDLSNDPDALEIVKVCWVFYISRLVEFFDTEFLILKEKKSKLSHFHVFHRCVTLITVWYQMKYGPGGYNTFILMADCFMRILMYLYYGFSAIVPAIQKYLFMKECLTVLQMVQFLSVIGYMSRLYLCPPNDCKVFNFLIWLSLSQASVGLVVSVYLFLSSSRTNAAKGIEKYKKK